MGTTPLTTEVLVAALGNTYPIKDQLKEEGFRWNKANKVWYYLGRPSTAQYEFLIEMMAFFTGPHVYFRLFERRENTWAEITC
ncbi:hypothetical protein ES707_04929 [subsurface metagenome]